MSTSVAAVDVGVGREVGAEQQRLVPALAPLGVERGADLAGVGVAEHRFAVHEPQEVEVVEEPRELATRLLDDQLSDRRGIRGAHGSRSIALAVHGADQLGLRREVVVEPGHGHAGGVGELPHAHRGGAPLGEEAQRAFDHPVPGRDRGSRARRPSRRELT